MFDPQPGQGAAHLGELGAVGGGAGGRCVDGPAGAVGVERPGKAVRVQDVAQGRHDGGRTLAALDELGVEQVLGGGVIQHHKQGVQRGRLQGQPGMPAAVEMDQFAEVGRGSRRRR